MLLANSSVSGKAATGHVLMYAPTGGFPRILALHPKSLRQIGNLWFFKTNSGRADEPSMGGSFFCGERGGDRSIGGANLRKGLCPFNGSGTAAPFYGSGPAARPRPASKMDSLAWLRWAGAGRACRRGGKPPAAIGKANAPAPETSDSKFDSLRGKMLSHFILPESLIL